MQLPESADLEATATENDQFEPGDFEDDLPSNQVTLVVQSRRLGVLTTDTMQLGFASFANLVRTSCE